MVDEHPDEHGRPWRARLWPAPPRLAHLVAVFGVSEQDVLERTALWVEQYDSVGMVPRERGLGR